MKKPGTKFTKTMIVKKDRNGTDVRAVAVKVNGQSAPVNARWSKSF